ncbi:MAG: SpoIIE family protein phosphatase [Bacteroidetes bacterium]|jgi:sigma-B regulation protein RsbU (phosphoserine phosphatase)|nr:SpoIIE family protein phosphatase [Bacteroidota bacterium]MCB0605143.1 SpoIIE family protein phosphatase [Saprospiraceae bacterium]MCO5276394.1 SpoIIE family protein phosphatase [Saprospiraceae bacterium]
MLEDVYTQTKVKKLEEKLYYKEIQVNSLSQITREINENASAETLFLRFNSYLKLQMGVDKMLLLFKEADNCWHIKSNIGFETLPQLDYEALLKPYTHAEFLNKKDKKQLADMEYIIPIRHKEIPIAYVILGHFGSKLKVHDNYEFVATLANIIAVAIENKRLFNRQLQQEKFNNEIRLATEVQRMLIPEKWPQGIGFEVSSIYRPLWNIGGDYLDCIPIDHNRTAFCIADVSGKGIAAAMLMANFQAILHQVIKSSIRLEDLVCELNKAVVRITNSEKIITFFIGEFNNKSKTLTYINAGHVPPLYFSQGKLHFLDQGTTLLGAVENLPTPKATTIDICADSMIVLYTDGITDLKNTNDCSFEEEILYSFICDHCDMSPIQFNTLLLQQLESFNTSDNFPDDIAVLTCKLTI